MPFCHLQIKALWRPGPDNWITNQSHAESPQTLGEHIRKCRIEKRLLQTDLARLLEVDRVTIQNWERGVWRPTIRSVPKIINFLGFDPDPPPELLRRKIAFARRRLGFTQEDLASALGVGPVTIWEWESGRSKPSERTLQKLQSLLDYGPVSGITLLRF